MAQKNLSNKFSCWNFNSGLQYKYNDFSRWKNSGWESVQAGTVRPPPTHARLITRMLLRPSKKHHLYADSYQKSGTISRTFWVPPKFLFGHPLGTPMQNNLCACMRAQLFQSCLTLCDPWTVALQAPLSRGLSKQEDWRGLPCPPPGDLLNPGDWTHISCVSCIAGRFFTTEPLGKPAK